MSIQRTTAIGGFAVALVAGLAVVGAPGVASAANGAAWLLGRSNAESAPTTVTNSTGTPLVLNAKAGYAPLKVNSTKVVPTLNSDMVDGYHSSSFAMRSGKTGTIVHDGTYDGLGAKCPSGTVFVSGGGYAPYEGESIIYSGPDWDGATGKLIPNSWIVGTESGYGVSNVTCYQPSGAAIPGVATSVDQTTGSSAVAAAAAGRALPLSDQAVAKIGQMKDMQTTAPEAPSVR
jgi:hypothetical protein